MPTVSILVPTYNEAENIDLLLTRIFAVEELRGVDGEVVFSGGAPPEATPENGRVRTPYDLSSQT